MSAKGRAITQSENGASEHLEGLIQTDAAINPGNSGGAAGERPRRGRRHQLRRRARRPNIGFAIDINSVKDVIDQLKQGKDVAAADPFLGVGTASVSELDDATHEQYGVTVDQGAVITRVVAGSAAEDDRPRRSAM